MRVILLEGVTMIGCPIDAHPENAVSEACSQLPNEAWGTPSLSILCCRHVHHTIRSTMVEEGDNSVLALCQLEPITDELGEPKALIGC